MTNIYGYAKDSYFRQLAIGSPSYLMPYADGNDGDQLQTDGKGTVTWSAATSGSGDLKSLIVNGTTTMTGAVTCSSTLTVSASALASFFRATGTGSLSSVNYQFGSANTGVYLNGSQFIYVVNGSTIMAFNASTLSPAVSTMNLGQSGLTWNTVYCNSVITPNSGSMTTGAIACSSVTSSGTMSATSITASSTLTANIMLIGTTGTPSTSIIGSSSLAGPSLWTKGSGSTTDGGALAIFGTANGETTAANLYGILIQKSGVDSLRIGVNKNSISGDVAASALYITSGNTNSVISIGRGSGTGLPSKNDILIQSTGSVSMTNGQLAIASTAYSSTSLNVGQTGSTTDGGSMALFQGAATATNLSGITIGKASGDYLMIGHNKNSVTGGIPSLSNYISTISTTGKLAIGRGDGVSLPSTADILLNGDGTVTMANGSLTLPRVIQTTLYEIVGSQSTKQTFTTGLSDNFYIDTTDFNTNWGFTPSTSAKTFTMPVDGWLEVSGTLFYPALAGGQRVLSVLFNGTARSQIASLGSSSIAYIQNFQASGRLTAGTTVRVSFFQDSGSSPAITALNLQLKVWT